MSNKKQTGMIFTTRDMIDSKAIQSNTAEIRKENKPLLFITLTLHTSDYYRQMAMEAGADCFFSKAVDFEKVAVVVDEMLFGDSFMLCNCPARRNK